MKVIGKLILIAIAMLAFTGCEEKFLTSHPDEGGIILTTDWQNATDATPPATFQARIISSSSGNVQDFDNLQGTTNSLVVAPGEAVVYVFNKADKINISENRAKVIESIYGGISPEPGIFYSCSEKITAERDRDINLAVTVRQRTGDLKLSLSIMPAEMLDRVRQVKAVLEGVCSELNMQTNELSATSFISATLTKSSYYASANLQLFGFDTSAKQNLKLEITLDNSDVLNVADDVTQHLTGFNDARNTPQSLSGILHVSQTAASVDNWKRNAANSYLSVSPLEITLPYGVSEESATVTTDQALWTYSAVNAGEWLTVTKTDNRLTLHTAENPIREPRKATVHVSTGGGLTQSVNVMQEAAPEKNNLSVNPASLTYEAAETGNKTVSVTTNAPEWNVAQPGDATWLSLEKAGNSLIVKVPSANTQTIPRSADITFTGGNADAVTLTVTQKAAAPQAYYRDREVVKLQSATVGRGIPLVLMGDGYTEQYMETGTGKYETDMRTAADHFFSVYPLSQYRNYFNIYMVAAISNEEGISIRSPRTDVDTKFETLWEGAGSTGISCNYSTVIEYVNAVSELSLFELDNVTVLLPINKYIYAGTCRMVLYSEQRYGQGFSISMCPVGSSFREIVVHESAGHGFAKLTDEYIHYVRETYPEEDKADDIIGKSYDWYENIDFYPDIMQTTWSGFANNPKYSMVGTFEGAQMYGKGIWRPEENSCMNDNVLYFNAPSRWAQVRRIMYLAGFNYSFAQFLQDDVVPAYPRTRSYVEKFVPLAPPIIEFKKSPAP